MRQIVTCRLLGDMEISPAFVETHTTGSFAAVRSLAVLVNFTVSCIVHHGSSGQQLRIFPPIDVLGVIKNK